MNKYRGYEKISLFIPKGTNLNGEHQTKTQDAAMCQSLCQKDSRCQFWTFVTTDFAHSSYHRDCYLKAGDVQTSNQYGTISGPKECGKGMAQDKYMSYVLCLTSQEMRNSPTNII